jgi:hypothetical protein
LSRIRPVKLDPYNRLSTDPKTSLTALAGASSTSRNIDAVVNQFYDEKAFRFRTVLCLVDNDNWQGIKFEIFAERIFFWIFGKELSQKRSNVAVYQAGMSTNAADAAIAYTAFFLDNLLPIHIPIVIISGDNFGKHVVQLQISDRRTIFLNPHVYGKKSVALDQVHERLLKIADE